MRKFIACLMLSAGSVPAMAAAEVANEADSPKASERTIVVIGDRLAGEVNSCVTPGEPRNWRLTISRRF